MLDAAMERKYSASPGEAFFTGSGMHVFHNFEKKEDTWNTSVTENPFKHSVNLAFIRIMRDVSALLHRAQKATAPRGCSATAMIPARETYLRRFADQEGREIPRPRFYTDYPRQVSRRGAGHAGQPCPLGAAPAWPIAYRSARPQATIAQFKTYPGPAPAECRPRRQYDREPLRQLQRRQAVAVRTKAICSAPIRSSCGWSAISRIHPAAPRGPR